MTNLKKLGLVGLVGTSLLVSPLLGCGKKTEEKTSSEIKEQKTEEQYQTTPKEETTQPKKSQSKIVGWHRRNSSLRDERKDYVETFADLNIKMLYFDGRDVELFRNLENETQIESVEPFWISESEITVGQWLAYLERDRSYDPKKDTYDWRGGIPENIRNPNMPITRVSFLNALRFVSYLSARTGKNYGIPTAGEWLLAWRGENLPKEGIYGIPAKETANIFWIDKDLERRVKEMENSRGAVNLREWAELREKLERNEPRLMQVKSLKPNQYGVYDMLGNAAEFVYIDLTRLNRGIFAKRSDMMRDRSFIMINERPCFICLTPGIGFVPDQDKNLKEFEGYFPKPYDDGYSKSEILFGDNVGFRIVRRLEKEEK